MAAETQTPAAFGWWDDSIGLTIEVDQAGTARIAHLGAGAPTEGNGGTGLPLVDVVIAGEGRGWSRRRYCESVAGRRLRYQGHAEVSWDETLGSVTVTLPRCPSACVLSLSGRR
jgi:hypothetical protein